MSKVAVAVAGAVAGGCVGVPRMMADLTLTAWLPLYTVTDNTRSSAPSLKLLLQELMQEGVLVSPRMMADHMPDYLTAVLQRLAEHAGQGTTGGERANGDFTVEIPPSPPVVKRGSRDFDNRSLQHVLRNSLANARAYTESEEEVELQ